MSEFLLARRLSGRRTFSDVPPSREDGTRGSRHRAGSVKFSPAPRDSGAALPSLIAEITADMKPELITLEPAARPTKTRNILAKDGFNCSLILLSPNEEIPRVEAAQVEEHILFVVHGEVTVHFEDMNTMLNQDEALLIAKGKEYSLSVRSAGECKLLRVDVPPRQIVTPQILSFDV